MESKFHNDGIQISLQGNSGFCNGLIVNVLQISVFTSCLLSVLTFYFCSKQASKACPEAGKSICRVY